MPQIKLKKSISINHKWRFRTAKNGRILMHSYLFMDDSLPCVEFKIVSGPSSSNTLDVIVSTTPQTSAHVSIGILVNKQELARKNINEWIDDCIFHDLKYTVEPRFNDEIDCEITFNGFANEDNLQPIGLYNYTKRLLMSPNFADIRIIVNNEKIPAHKMLLAIQSPVFTAMFQTNMKEAVNGEIEIEDISGDIMKKVLEFLYTGKLNKNPDVDDLLPLLAAADKYEIMSLKNLCEKLLCRQITLDTALHILEIASLYGVPQLIERIITFMVMNKKEIVELDEFRSVHQKKPELFWEFIIRIV